MASGFAAIDRRLDKIHRDVLSGQAAADTAREIGMMAKGQVGQLAGPAALGGDNAFSGWRRSGPIVLTAAFSPHKSNPGGVTIHRGRTAGPWKVATVGRNQGTGGGGGFFGPGIRSDGTTARTKTGRVRKVRGRGGLAEGVAGPYAPRLRRRWNGPTRGFGSWDQFEDAVLEKVPGTVDRQVRKQLSRAVLG